MRVYNQSKTGKAAACEKCGQRKYNKAQVYDFGVNTYDRLVAERRRKIDIEIFVKVWVGANLPESPVAGSIALAIERYREWDGLRICSDCENELYEAVRAILVT